ncbi:sensor histidine kinase [Streptomonospora sediminis]
MDFVLWGCCAALVAVETDSVRADPLPEAAAMAVLLACAFALRRRRPFTALGVVLGAVVVQAVVIALTLVSALVLGHLVVCAVLAFSAGRRSGRTPPMVAMVSTAVLATLMAYAVTWVRIGDARETLTGLTDWAGGVAAIVGVVVAPWLLGRYWRHHSELRTAGWEIADRMERARDLDAERARLRERARIATEMHDSLGHELALIAVRAAALEMAPGGDGTRSAAGELRTAAHGANLRLREIIGVLREDTGTQAAERHAEPGEDAAAVVDRAVRAGLGVRLVREGTGPGPDSPAGRAVHRVVQEALTNAARYAPQALVTVRLVHDGDGATTVHVADTGGSAAPAAQPGTGSGLAGLRALVEGMGGEFSAGPARESAAAGGAGRRGRGFTVTARIPGTAEAPQPPAAAGRDTAPGTGSEIGGPETATGTRPGTGLETGLGPGPEAGTETARRLRGARANARRWLATAVAVPLALAGVIVGAGFGVLWYVGSNSVLAPADYAQLAVGQDRAATERELPRFDYPADDLVDPPPAPPGAACRFYLVEWENGVPPVYRLCFDGGRLAAKDRIARE